MGLYQSAKDEIKTAVDIVELIGQFVQMKKAGQNYLGLCPFHSEKTPSFTVSPAKQIFHCFGCKKGGDVFAFWMEYHKVSFPEALRDLADKYQVSLPRKQPSSSERKKKELLEVLFQVNEAAADYYHHILVKSEKGSPGRGYLEKRSISGEIISQFRLGYAPDEWDGLVECLRSKKIEMAKAVQAGLIIPKKHGGYYDRFRGRVIFTIFNLRQQIAGFGGRVLDDSLPKYLNTPETPVFHKGELLYGLHAAYRPIRQSGRLVVVEGYTDVLALNKHGFHEAVATLGTAITRSHIRKIKGYASEAVIVFDADAAGKAAAMNSLSSFLDEGFSSEVVILPEGYDPDSFVNKKGLGAFLELLEQSIPLFEFFLDLKLSSAAAGIEGKVSVLKEILPILNEMDNAAQRSFYAQRLSERIGIPQSAVLAEMRKWVTAQSGKGEETGLREKLSALKAKKRDDADLLNLFIHYPYTLDRLMKHGCSVLLSDQVFRDIFDSMYQIYAREGETQPADILDRLEGEIARERFREAMLSPPIYSDEMVEQAVREFENKIDRVRMSESINIAREKRDLEGLNQLLKLRSNKID